MIVAVVSYIPIGAIVFFAETFQIPRCQYCIEIRLENENPNGEATSAR